MEKQIKIYDPIHTKVYTLNFDELRFWFDIPAFQRLFNQQNELNNAFQRLDGVNRENFLKFLDTNESLLPFKVNNWEGIPGMELSLTLHVQHNLNGNAFHDHVNQGIRDRFFSGKNIFTQKEKMYATIASETFPMDTLFYISEEFCKTELLTPETPYPIFQSYIGNGTDFDEKFLLNYSGEIDPVSFNIPIYQEREWTYSLEVVIKPITPHEDVLWTNTPKVRHLFDFFADNGFKVRTEGPHRTFFENTERGDLVEYNIPPSHLYPPFINIRKHNGKLDFNSRQVLGEQLMEKMKKEGLWEEILHFRAYLLETEALSRIQNNNKKPADKLLSEAIEKYELCDGHLRSQAQLESIFCAWLKSRIAVNKGDKFIELRSYDSILSRYANLHLWEDFLWFLDHSHHEDKQNALKSVRNHLPILDLDKYFFMNKATYKRILEYWDRASVSVKRPKKENVSEWHYNLAYQSYDIGLKDTARYHLLMFFKLTQKNPEGSEWAIEGTEELLDFAIKVDARKQYMRFAQTMAEFMRRKRKEEGIGDMSAIGRKEYRWILLTLTLSEGRWAFHSGYLLKKENKEKPEQIKRWFKSSYEAFYEAILHYDATEGYTKAQTVTIAKGFVTGYHLAFTMKDENFISYLLDLSRELWKRNPSKELYVALQSLFSKEERKEMADSLITKWMEEVKRETGSFTLDVEKVLILSDLYLSVEEWEDCAKTLNYGLTKLNWDFEPLNSAFKTFLSLQKFAPEQSEICEVKLYALISDFQNEKAINQQFGKSTKSRIRRIEKV